MFKEKYKCKLHTKVHAHYLETESDQIIQSKIVGHSTMKIIIGTSPDSYFSKNNDDFLYDLRPQV